MPYIKQDDRRKYDPAVDALSDALAKDATPGDLNYCISRIIWELFDRKESYTKANELVGVLECVKQEFIRRRLNHYEDLKIIQNGDVGEKREGI